jgi:ribosome biogenesis GTPase
MLKGIVTLTTGSWYEVLTSENNSIKARLKGKFKLDDIKSTNPIAIGDRVVVEWDKEYGDYSISEIEQRSNYIVRQSPRQKHTKHIIAAQHRPDINSSRY